MKTKYFLLVLVLSFTATNVSSQELDILGVIQENAELYEQSNSDENPDPNDPNAEEIYGERWRQYLRTAEEEYAAELNGLGEYERCAAMMIIYLDKYYQLEEEIENAPNCQMKYDLYGMQLLGIAAGTTIMYCPEKISNLTEQSQYDAMKNFAEPYFDQAIREPHWMYVRDDTLFSNMISRVWREFLGNPDGYPPSEVYYGEWIDWMWKHFHPASTVAMVLGISQKMEALPCGG